MIVFSGLTVAVSLIALCVFPQRFLYSIGIGGALVALSSAAVCLLLLPAVLGLLGERVNALAPPRLQGIPSERRWHRLARFVLSYPISVTVVAASLMIFAGLPFLRVELTQANAQILPSTASAHEVERIVSKRFEADPADRMVLVYRSRPAADFAREKLIPDQGVVDVEGPQRVGPGLYQLDAELGAKGYSDEAVSTLKRARSANWGVRALIGG